MQNKYSDRPYTAFTQRGIGGLLRELVTDVLVRIPEMFTGFSHEYQTAKALWDTGATDSVISTGFAARLGIQPTGKTETYGVHGKQTVNTYLVDLLLGSVSFTNWRVTEGKIGPGKLDVIIGMDIIARGDFCITQEKNPSGRPCTVFSFRLPSMMLPIDYRQEITEFNRQKRLTANNKMLRAEYRNTHPSKKPRSKRKKH